MDNHKDTILILGASGFVGNAIYRELLPYYDTYGTYCKQQRTFAENQVFFQYDCARHSVLGILERVRPSVIISAFDGPYRAQARAHSELCGYLKSTHCCRLLYISSALVFDGTFRFPVYENDVPCSESKAGALKISIEKELLHRAPAQVAILRLPWVLGVNAPQMLRLRQAIRHKTTFEVFPALIISVTTVDKVAQQIHYIVNQKCDGIFHLASGDMVHHGDLFTEICERLDGNFPIFKNVFNRNGDSYLAILPKVRPLPKNYTITVQQVIEDCTLQDVAGTFTSTLKI